MESHLQSSTPVSFLNNDKDSGKMSSYNNIKQSNSQLKLNPHKFNSSHSYCTKPLLFTEKASSCPNCLNISQLNKHPNPHFVYTNQMSQSFNLYPYHRPPSHYEHTYRRKYHASRRNNDSTLFDKNPNQSKMMFNHNKFNNTNMNAPQPAYVPTALALPTSYMPVTFPIKSLPHFASNLNLNNQLSTQLDPDKLAILLNLMEAYIKELKKPKYENTIKQNSLYHERENKDFKIHPTFIPKASNPYDYYKNMMPHRNLTYNNQYVLKRQFPFVSPSNDINASGDFGYNKQIPYVF